MQKRTVSVLLALLIVMISQRPSLGGIVDGAPVYGYKVVNAYPHNPLAFTQGLIFDGGFLYEGTGLYGRSELRKTELKTGRVVKSRKLSGAYFGEGVTEWKGDIIQLTWLEKKGFVYDKETFRPLRDFSVSGEGWGLTHDDKRLIMSDGSSYLYFLDPKTFRPIDRIEVHDDDVPVANLNELEYIKGRIYANVWPTDRIAIISPETGVVEAWVDLTGISPTAGSSREDVLNGIAYDRKRDRLFVTGKLWPKLYEIQIVPPHSP